jgi:hypothetical protein
MWWLASLTDMSGGELDYDLHHQREMLEAHCSSSSRRKVTGSPAAPPIRTRVPSIEMER